MKYRLKQDHTKTLEAYPTRTGAPPWMRVDYYESQHLHFSFEAPATFLEVSGWEPVPEKEPNPPEAPRHRLDVPCNEFLCLPEDHPDHYCTPTEAYQLLENNRIQIQQLKESRNKAAQAVAQLEQKVGEAVSLRDEALKNNADLWRKYAEALRCNAELGMALVEKMTEGK
jgi:hypothetical protein